jgi:hypothetical protein
MFYEHQQRLSQEWSTLKISSKLTMRISKHEPMPSKLTPSDGRLNAMMS